MLDSPSFGTARSTLDAVAHTREPALRVASAEPAPVLCETHGITDRDRRDFRILLLAMPALAAIAASLSAICAAVISGQPA